MSYQNNYIVSFGVLMTLLACTSIMNILTFLLINPRQPFFGVLFVFGLIIDGVLFYQIWQRKEDRKARKEYFDQKIRQKEGDREVDYSINKDIEW